MTFSFRVRETTASPLWDFGWFDLTRFKVDGVPAEGQVGADVLREFLRDPISQRSFCTRPDPWGNSGDLHGPFPTETLAAEWYRPLSIDELQQRVTTILDNPEFAPPPSPEQRLPVVTWLQAVRARGEDVLVLEERSARVDWDVWLVFHEFVCFSPGLDEMTVAVIGYD